jgi:hypothetical protein
MNWLALIGALVLIVGAFEASLVLLVVGFVIFVVGVA